MFFSSFCSLVFKCSNRFFVCMEKRANTFLKTSKGCLLAPCKKTNLHPASKHYFVSCKRQTYTLFEGFKRIFASFLKGFECGSSQWFVKELEHGVESFYLNEKATEPIRNSKSHRHLSKVRPFLSYHFLSSSYPLFTASYIKNLFSSLCRINMLHMYIPDNDPSCNNQPTNLCK